MVKRKKSLHASSLFAAAIATTATGDELEEEEELDEEPELEEEPKLFLETPSTASSALRADRHPVASQGDSADAREGGGEEAEELELTTL